MVTFITLAQMHDDVYRLAARLPSVSAVLGVPRSGALVASLLAARLGVPMGLVGGKVESGLRLRLGRAVEGPALVVDDSVYQGGAMAQARKRAPGCLYACLYVAPGSEDKVDYFSRVVPGPRFFEWNFLGIHATSKFMFDMDGVLCREPCVFDDDGEAYQSALRKAEPFMLPTVPVHSVVTSRLERWRPITENWLGRQGLQYGNLVMRDFTSAADRRAVGDPGGYKGQVFADSDATLFIESSHAQALRIHEVSRKPALSVERMQLCGG